MDGSQIRKELGWAPYHGNNPIFKDGKVVGRATGGEFGYRLDKSIALAMVKHTPRVSMFVGGKKDKPSPISKSDVDNIINRIEVGEEAPRPKTLFEPGEVIRVCDGPFNDFNGVVEEVVLQVYSHYFSQNMLRVQVIINI